MKKRARLADVMKHNIESRNREWQEVYKKRKEKHKTEQKGKHKETLAKVKEKKPSALKGTGKKYEYSVAKEYAKKASTPSLSTSLKTLRFSRKHRENK